MYFIFFKPKSIKTMFSYTGEMSYFLNRNKNKIPY